MRLAVLACRAESFDTPNKSGAKKSDCRTMKPAVIPIALAVAAMLWPSRVALSAPVDRFGGSTSWTSSATGDFRLEQTHDRWWLITPEGRGMIALGLNHISELKQPADYARTVFAQRYGTDWPRVFAEVEKQCREWGFNSAGFQAPPEMRATMPYILGTKFADVSFWLETLTYVDVFAPAFTSLAEAKAKAAAEEMKANPMCIAWTWTDSLCWDIVLTRKSHRTDFVSFMRELPPGAPGRVRYAAFLRERHRDLAALNSAYGVNVASWEALARADWSKLERERKVVLADDRHFLRLIARQYYQSIGIPFRREHPRGLQKPRAEDLVFVSEIILRKKQQGNAIARSDLLLIGQHRTLVGVVGAIVHPLGDGQPDAAIASRRQFGGRLLNAPAHVRAGTMERGLGEPVAERDRGEPRVIELRADAVRRLR